MRCVLQCVKIIQYYNPYLNLIQFEKSFDNQKAYKINKQQYCYQFVIPIFKELL